MEFNLNSIQYGESCLEFNLDKFNIFFQKYDYIIIDTSPAFNTTNINAFIISDNILLISDSSKLALSCINNFINEWNSICKKIKIPNKANNIILNNINNYYVSKDFEEFIRTKMGNKVFKNIIKTKESIKRTTQYGEDLSLKNNPYINLYKEFKEREVL